VWAWDPVENASLLPWLTGTAYIHSVLVQERRGMLRVWNLSLLIATFALTILGTFLTRSGVLNSVHAFGDGPVGAWLLTFFGVIVVVSLGLIAWRGDRLRSPGAIDSPISREGAFLANNVIFTVFAFVVLLGTVFPLLVEALQDRQTIVGAPYFDRLTQPIGLVLLFLMAVAPVLPWRKASTELLRERLFWPAWAGVAALGLAVAVGADGWPPLIAFGFAGFAAGAALRQLVLATRRQGWRGLVGRANGGMVVHIGVIMIAVALAASNSFTHSATIDVAEGEVVEWGGHTFELTSVTETTNDRASERVLAANVVLDGGSVYRPAITTYLNIGQDVGTPAVRTSLTRDVYLTLEPGAAPGDSSATIRVFVKPMIAWLWLGGFVMALGTLLAAFPGGRRRPIDPVSAPVEPARVPAEAGSR
jgi:cytochrome c-type biogenesis protein CcmF